MITSPRNSTDLKYIDIPPVNTHGWFNRACALTRWALNPDNNESLTQMLKIQAQLALRRFHNIPSN